MVGKPGERETQLYIPFAIIPGGHAAHLGFLLEVAFIHVLQAAISALYEFGLEFLNCPL